MSKIGQYRDDIAAAVMDGFDLLIESGFRIARSPDDVAGCHVGFEQAMILGINIEDKGRTADRWAVFLNSIKDIHSYTLDADFIARTRPVFTHVEPVIDTTFGGGIAFVPLTFHFRDEPDAVAARIRFEMTHRV